MDSRMCRAVVAAALLVAASAFQFNSHAETIESALGGITERVAFRNWMVKFGKEYGSSAEEEHRFGVWQSNLELVLQKNLGAKHSVKLGVNSYTDLTREEFRAAFLYNPQPFELPERSKHKKPVDWRYDHVRPSEQVDWRDEGVVGPIRNQHAHNWSCGSCWAFATTGIAEISNAMYVGHVVPGSEQQLIDCDRKKDYGCDGGDIHNGLNYIIENKGLNTEDHYPYIGHDGECKVKLERKGKVKVSDWERVPSWNETALMQALTMRPVVTAVCCGSNIDDWHHYTGGVFDIDCCADEIVLDHAMVIVGYGEEDGEAYWLLKNSWGTEWGEGGFIKMKRFVNDGEGQCALASMPTLVVRGEFPPPNTDVVRSALYSVVASVRKMWYKVKHTFFH